MEANKHNEYATLSKYPIMDGTGYEVRSTRKDCSNKSRAANRHYKVGSKAVLLRSWTKIVAGLDSSGHSAWNTDYTPLPVSVKWKSSKTSPNGGCLILSHTVG